MSNLQAATLAKSMCAFFDSTRDACFSCVAGLLSFMKFGLDDTVMDSNDNINVTELTAICMLEIHLLYDRTTIRIHGNLS